MNANRNAMLETISDLYTWKVETGKKLPTYPAKIAEIERAGSIVDLETGEVFYPKDEEQREPDRLSIVL